MVSIKSTGFQNKLDRLVSLFFVTTIVFATPFHSLKVQIRIDQWTTDNGLPQNSVTGIAQTTDGYIWFTTNEGLVRFDGVRFKVFNRSNTPEIPNNRMSGAFADKSGTIWMNTEEREILSYEKGVFKKALRAGEIRWPRVGSTVGSVRQRLRTRICSAIAASEYPSDALRRNMGRDVVTATV